MTTLEKIAFFQNQRDEIPNQLLAKELAVTKDIAGIREIAENLTNKNKNVRSDCVKVLYEIGYIDPGLIVDHAQDLLNLLKLKENRMVWGAMIGLAAIADLCPQKIWIQIEDIIHITKKGTVITQVWGMRVLAKVAAADQRYNKNIYPFLLNQIRTCIPRDVPTHSESILCAVDAKNKGELLSILEDRKKEMSPAQLVRFKKVLKSIQSK